MVSFYDRFVICFFAVRLYIKDMERSKKHTEKIETEGSFSIAVSAVIEDTQSQILITKRAENRRHAPGEWELVTGRIKPEEKDMPTALAREIKEEVGLEVDIIVPYRTFYFEHGPNREPHFGVNFFCKHRGNNSDVVLDEKEQSDYLWVPPERGIQIVPDQDVKEAIKEYVKFREIYKYPH